MAKKGGLFGGEVGAGKEALFKVRTEAVDTTPPSAPVDDLSSTGRKKRKDYLGVPSKKKDYHHTSLMLGVRVPEEIARQIRQRAADSQQSINAWLLSLIVAELEKEN